MISISQQAVVNACKELNIPFQILHKDRIIIKVNLTKPLFFYHHYKPFNRSDIAHICKDKDLSYDLLHKHISLPKWKPYLAPNCNPDYQYLVKYKTATSITKDIEQHFRYPLIVKMNKGSQGKNVFKCENNTDIQKALNTIFNRDSKNYDYIAIAQEYINIKQEYRVLAWKSQALLIYEKSIKDAKFEGNLSPLHWKNAKAIHVKDANLQKEMENFIEPIFQVLPINFIGLDIAVNNNGKMFLLEINNAPGVAKFVEDNSLEPITAVLSKILLDIKTNGI